MNIDNIAEAFVANYNTFKYDPNATLQGFVMYWDPKTKKMHPDPREFPENGFYGPFASFTAHLRSDKRWQDPRVRLPKAFVKHNFLAGVATNAQLIRDAFTSALGNGLRSDFRRRAYDYLLIEESAKDYSDTFDERRLRNNPQKCTLEYFLRNFDVEKRRLKREVKRPNYDTYRPLFLRLTREQEEFEGLYLERLQETDISLRRKISKLGSRVTDVLEGNDSYKRLAQILESRDNESILAEFGSSDLIEDLLVALRGEKETQKVGRERSVIRDSLGVCRRRRPPTFDAWENAFTSALKAGRITPNLYDGNLAVQRILQTHFVIDLLDLYDDGVDVLKQLRARSIREKDPVQKKLLNYGISHFELIQSIRGIPEIRKSLSVVSIK
jgi:hypothetical protein